MSIIASCGHELADDEDTVSVRYGEEACDAIDGLHRVVVYAEFCPRCEIDWRAKGWLLASEAEADAYLDGSDMTHRYDERGKG